MKLLLTCAGGIMVIDCHVHFRDEEEAHKETIEHGLLVARDSGVSAVFDMPNTKRPVISRERVEERLALAKKAGVKEVFYGTYIGLTADEEQIKEAVAVYREFFPRVVGFKLYAGHSVGNLGVICEEDQRKVFFTLAREGYDGVLAVHAEKESLMHKEVWNYREPITHCIARPPEAEIESAKDMIKFSLDYKFEGKLHIAHVSAPEAVEIIDNARNLGVDISGGACPHHFIYGYGVMLGKDGIMYKVNPPLRKPGDNKKMLEFLREGKIDLIETDHAPHTIEEKISGNFMSGITGIQNWGFYKEYLFTNGFAAGQVERLTFGNVTKRFGFEVEMNKRDLIDRRGDYPFDYYELAEGELKMQT